VKRHALTNRVIYDKDLVNMAKMVSDAGHGGQIVLTSETLADIGAPEKFSEVGFVLHMGLHLLQQPQLDMKSQADFVVPMSEGCAIAEALEHPPPASTASSSKSLMEGEPVNLALEFPDPRVFLTLRCFRCRSVVCGKRMQLPATGPCSFK
jgi:hypothetical protein